MRVKIKKLEIGQTFAFRKNYFITDNEGGIVQLTGKNAGEVFSISDFPKTVKLVDLEIGEVE